MKYSILITSSPYSCENSISAFLFSKALIERKHQLVSVFFYSEGVFNANKTADINNDCTILTESWKRLSVDFNIKLYICIEAAFQRGMILKKNLKREKVFKEMINSEFKLVGLLTFVKSVELCDRILQF